MLLRYLETLCKGGSTISEAFVNSVTRLLPLLEQLDDKVVSDEYTKHIVEYIVDIFLSNLLLSHIVQICEPNSILKGFFLGFNSDLQSKRLAIVKLF
jgi:hypothetical protein